MVVHPIRRAFLKTLHQNRTRANIHLKRGQEMGWIICLSGSNTDLIFRIMFRLTWIKMGTRCMQIYLGIMATARSGEEVPWGGIAHLAGVITVRWGGLNLIGDICKRTIMHPLSMDIPTFIPLTPIGTDLARTGHHIINPPNSTLDTLMGSIRDL